MGLFHRKKAADKSLEDKELISENERSVDSLIVLAQQANNEQFVVELKQLKEKIKYLIPSTDDKVRDYDKKIKNLIGDLRIALVKGDSEVSVKANNLLTQIKLAIADRNAKI